MQQPGIFRQKPIFPLSWESTVWKISSSFQKILSYDCNLDGWEELLLVGEKEILFFRGTKEGWLEKPFCTISTEEEIHSLDFTHPPGKSHVWLVLLLDTRILFFPDLEKESPILVDSIKQDDWKAKSVLPLRQPFFQDIDNDSFLDLLIPFRKNFSWHAALYLYKENKFHPKGVLDLQASESFLPPSLGILQEKNKTEILFQDKEILKIYSHDREGYFFSHPQKILDFRKYTSGKFPYMLSLTEIVQLNQNESLDFIFQEAPGQNLWICLDQKQVYSIPLDTLANLMINTMDYNKDGYFDLVCVCMGEANSFSLLWHYIVSGYLEIPLDILYLCNQKGIFVLERKERISLFLPYPLKPSLGKKFWGDLNGDGFLDCIEIQGKKIHFLYDVAGFLSTEKISLDPFSSAITPFLSLAIPEKKTDGALSLPTCLEEYSFSNAHILSVKGRQGRIVLHYTDSKKEKNLLLLFSKKKF